MRWLFHILAAAILGIVPVTAARAGESDSAPAEEIPPIAGDAGGVLQSLHRLMHRGNWVVTPAVVFGKETGFGGGLGIIWLMPGAEGEGEGERTAETRTSTVSLFGIYTQKHQSIFRISPDFYFRGRDWRFTVATGFSNFPTRFYGVGNDTPESNREYYTPRTVPVSSSLYRRIYSHLYAGLMHDFAWTGIVKSVPGGLISTGTITGSGGGYLSGLGPAVYWDSRDSQFFPSEGGYYQLSAILYDTGLGGDFDFTQYNADLRQFFSTWGGQVFAVQALLRFSTGDAPVNALPKLGGSSILRGIFEGRFMDRHQMVLQGEYRIPFWSFFGIHAFGGVGEVARNADDFSFRGLKYSAGGGLRAKISSRESINLRLDFAKGSGDFGVYFRVLEAF